MYVASVPVASSLGPKGRPLEPSPGYQGPLTREKEGPTLKPTPRRRPDATTPGPRPFAGPAAATGPRRPSGAGRNATEWPAAAAAAKLADVEKDAAPC